MTYEEFLLQLKKAERFNYEDDDDYINEIATKVRIIEEYLIERDKPNDNRTNSSS